MKLKPGHNTGLRARLNYVRARYNFARTRFLTHFEESLKTISSILRTLTSVASVVCAVVLVVYIGYNLPVSEIRLLKNTLRALELLYGLNIVFHLVFFFRTTVKESHVISHLYTSDAADA
ncbi:MAG: hypothetical protein K2K05_10265 [Muribaculaceae bacterium]|nr:hypothetical protein [Muribaculaceae bacterium]